MKSLIRATAVALTLATPALTFAQTNQPLTRAQVRAELAELKQAGFDPSDYFYPDSLNAAEAKVARQHDARHADESGYGHDRSAKAEFGGKQAMSQADAHSPLNLIRK